MSALSPRRRPVAVVRRALASVALPVVLGTLLLTGACGTSGGSGSASSGATGTPTTATTPVTPVAASTGSSTGSTTAAAGRAVPGPTTVAHEAPARLRPVRISIPRIGVDASMTDLGIAKDGVIEVPTDPAQAGWLDTTPAPGQQGPAVIAGHVDSLTGPAVFYELTSLHVGDPITVTRQNGSKVTFTVDGVRTYAKSAFPTREVYGPVPGPVLRLITCGGDYVKADGGYQANVVVYAS